MANTVHLSLQGKGGVGKSLVSAVLAQYLKQKGEDVRCVDTDPVNQTFSQYAALGASHLKLLDEGRIDPRAFDQLMDRLLTEDGVFVVDNGASTFVPLWHYILENNVARVLRDAGRRLYVHSVVTGGQALVDSPLQELHGRTVSAVGFDRAGFYLEFDGPKLFVFNPADIVAMDGQGVPVRSTDESFAQLLRSLLDRSVAEIEMRGDNLSLAFEAFVLRVSLRAEDYIGPEAINYTTESAQIVVV